MADSAEDLFVFGTIVGQHGLRGDLKVRPVTDGSEALAAASKVFLRSPDGVLHSHVPVRVSWHKRLLLLRLEGFDEINRAAGLVGCEVLMRLDELPDLTADEHYWHQLQGLVVVDRRRGELGTLQEMFTTAAHDIYVVRGAYGEVLIPAVPSMVLSIDIDAGRVEVDLPEGLVPQPDED